MLHRELIESGRMTATAFHDAVLVGGHMPSSSCARADGPAADPRPSGVVAIRDAVTRIPS
jgi:hypothetical protein